MKYYSFIFCLFFLLFFSIYSSSQYDITLFKEKTKPFNFEGEFDKSQCIQMMLDYKNIDYKIKEYKGKELKEKEEKSLFSQLPVLKIKDKQNHNTLTIPYFRTAERVLAKKLDLYLENNEDYQEYIIDEAISILDKMRTRWLFGDSIENGHNRWLFQENYIADWGLPSIIQLINLANKLSPNSKYFFSDTISIIEIKFYLLFNLYTDNVREKFLIQNKIVEEYYKNISTELDKDFQK